MEAWLLTGIWPMLNGGKVQMNLQLYFLRSMAYMTTLSATKRPHNLVHADGLHRLDLRACGLGLVKERPIKQLTTKRERKGAAAEQDDNSYKGAHPSGLDADSFAALTHRENSIYFYR